MIPAELQLWVDKAAIRELIERSVRCIDDADAPGLAALFEEDGALQLAGTVFAGREALTAMFRGAEALPGWTEPGNLLKQPASTHLTANPVIDVDGDTATAETDMVTLQRAEDRSVRITLLARYRDRFRRGADGTWRISSRTGVSVGPPEQRGTDAEWARALAKMSDEVRARFRPEG